MICKYRLVEGDKAFCKIAEELSGYKVETTDKACTTCIALPNAACPNSVTASLAVGALRQQNPELLKELMPKLAAHFKTSQSIPEAIGEGPGAELKNILSWFAKDTPDCECLNRARLMNTWGPQGCRNNIPTILGWLEEEATKRGLPFSKLVATQFVHLAINRAENANRENLRNQS